MQQPSPHRNHLLIGLGLILLAAAIRLPGIIAKPFWIAEVQEFAYAYRPGFLSHPEFSAGDWPGYTYHSLCSLLGLQPLPGIVRAPALLLGSILPGLLFFLLAQRRQAATGLLAGLFLAFSLPALQLSQEARLYASLSMFLALGLLLQWLSNPRSPRSWLLLGLCDGLALLSHPYAAFWLLVRWVAALASDHAWRQILFTRSSLVRYLPLPAAALGLQVFLVASAAARFRTVHQHFTLQPYPPDFPFLSELLGHLGAGNGLPAAIFGLLVGAGTYLLASRDRPGAILLAATGIAGPLLTLTAIWAARSRFGFVHLVPAAVPLYILSAYALNFCWRQAHNRKAVKPLIAAFVGLILLQMGWLDWRYHQRSTRLEMGADIAAACTALGADAREGDTVLTTYDKYFTLFAWYCGPLLAPGVSIAASTIPVSPFALAFNHLAADGNSGPLPVERMTKFEEMPLPSTGSTLFLLVPYFEDIEGSYSESLRWYDGTKPYGPALGPPQEVLAGWQSTDFPMLKLLRMEITPGMKLKQLRQAVQRIQAAKRSWF